MAASQFGALTPLQHYNQHQQQQQQQQHYSQLSFQQITQPAPPPPPPPQPPPPPAPPHQQPQSQSQSTPTNGSAGPLQAQAQTMNPNSAPSLISSPTNTPAIESPTDSPAAVDAQRRRRTAARSSKRRRSDLDAELPLSPVPPRPPTVHPLSKGPYNTLEDAIFSLQLHVFTSGYGVSQKRTVKEKLPSGKYDPDGEIIRKDFACDKGGNEFVSQSRGERRRESKKCGCPWKAAIRRLRREGDRWFIEILETQHNHPVTSPDEMHTLASYRRWQRENNAGIRSAISRLTRAAAMPARDIAAYLKGDLQDHQLDRIDKQILRALSMNDKEVPGSEKDGGSVVFEMIARRPVIILQDNQSTPSIAANGYASAPKPPPPPPMANFPNPVTPSTPFNESSATYHHTFANTFINPPNPQPHPPTTPMAGSGGTTNMLSEYPVVP